MSARKRLTRKQIMKNLSEIQHLIGKAEGIYMDDRNPMRADLLLKILKDAFYLTLDTRD